MNNANGDLMTYVEVLEVLDQFGYKEYPTVLRPQSVRWLGCKTRADFFVSKVDCNRGKKIEARVYQIAPDQRIEVELVCAGYLPSGVMAEFKSCPLREDGVLTCENELKAAWTAAVRSSARQIKE